MLNNLSAALGYTSFQINIDKSHTPYSCKYKMTLDHENEHVSSYIKAFDNESENVKKAIHLAADSIMPIFVPSLDGVNDALDEMQQELQSHPEIILMKQKLDAQQEILNKKVDERDDGKRINFCK
jgi:phosphoglycerate-specific signal transduction histidine kinase